MATKKPDPDSVKGVPGVKSWGFGEHSLWGHPGAGDRHGGVDGQSFFRRELPLGPEQLARTLA